MVEWQTWTGSGPYGEPVEVHSSREHRNSRLYMFRDGSNEWHGKLLNMQLLFIDLSLVSFLVLAGQGRVLLPSFKKFMKAHGC